MDIASGVPSQLIEIFCSTIHAYLQAALNSGQKPKVADCVGRSRLGENITVSGAPTFEN
jgi:hypothetical protein